MRSSRLHPWVRTATSAVRRALRQDAQPLLQPDVPASRTTLRKLLEPGRVGTTAVGTVQGELRLSTLASGRGPLAAKTEKPVLVAANGSGVPSIFTLDLSPEIAKAHAGEWVAVHGEVHKTNEFGGRIEKARLTPPEDRWGHVEIAPKDVHEALGQVMLVDGYPLVFDVEKSHGQWLHDSRSGRDFLDMFTFFASRPVAFDHPGLLDPAYQKRLATAARIKPSNSDIYTTELASFVDAFRRLAMPPEMAHLFLIEGGSAAVENALKAAFDWKTRKNQAAGSKVEADVVIHLERAFHGRGGYTLSLTNTDPKKTKLFPKLTWERVRSPGLHFPIDAREIERVRGEEQAMFQQLDEIYQRIGKERIACIVVEPIQSEGGDNHFRKEVFEHLRNICDTRDALLVFDEVQTGMGATGTMWFSEQTGVMPDLISFAKKAQTGGIMASRRLDEVENNVFSESSRINSTFGGNLVDQVRATRFLEIIHTENLLENVKQQGAYLLERVTALAAAHPDLLDSPRGEGTLQAFDVRTPELRNAIIALAYDEGLLVLPCGQRSIRLRPALDVTREDCATAMDMLERAVRRARLTDR